MITFMNTIAFALLVAVLGGTFATITMLSVARTVALYKHRDWTFNAAFNYVYVRGMLGLAVTAAIVAAIWLIPIFVSNVLPHDELKATQAIATVAVIVMTNIHYYAVVIEKIRRPPE